LEVDTNRNRGQNKKKRTLGHFLRFLLGSSCTDGTDQPRCKSVRILPVNSCTKFIETQPPFNTLGAAHAIQLDRRTYKASSLRIARSLESKVTHRHAIYSYSFHDCFAGDQRAMWPKLVAADPRRATAVLRALRRGYHEAQENGSSRPSIGFVNTTS